MTSRSNSAIARELELRPSTTRARARAVLTEAMRGLGFDQPEREATLLLAHAGAIRASDLISVPEAPLGDAAWRVADFAARRFAGEPLSRILGRREFWSLTFAITPDVLDPRADTETLVEAVLGEMKERRAEPLRVLDLGVGSGALLCALLSEFPRAVAIGVDLSERAAAIARANVETLGLGGRATIRVGNWGEGLEGPFDLIASNPPYIPAAEIAGLDREVREHDPRLALDGGPDGLEAYRALAPELARLLEPEKGRFFLEFGQGQAEAVRAILEGVGLKVIATLNDLSGRARVVAGRRA
jgi:release factor glutamine methyltransferase